MIKLKRSEFNPFPIDSGAQAAAQLIARAVMLIDRGCKDNLIEFNPPRNGKNLNRQSELARANYVTPVTQTASYDQISALLPDKSFLSDQKCGE